MLHLFTKEQKLEALQSLETVGLLKKLIKELMSFLVVRDKG